MKFEAYLIFFKKEQRNFFESKNVEAFMIKCWIKFTCRFVFPFFFSDTWVCFHVFLINIIPYNNVSKRSATILFTSDVVYLEGFIQSIC